MVVMQHIGMHLAEKLFFELEGPSCMSAWLCR